MPFPSSKIRAGLVIGVSVSLLACRGAAPERGVPSAAPTATPGPEVASVSATATATAAPSSSAGATSTSIWPDHTRAITLSWIIHPATGDPGPPGRHIDLVARAGAVQRLVPIDARYSISFGMFAQPLCKRVGMHYDSPKVAAELVMNGGGNLWYTVERNRADALEVFQSSSSDGLCTDKAGRETACPVERILLATIEIPTDATLTERFLEVDREESTTPGVPGRVREKPLSCGSD